MEEEDCIEISSDSISEYVEDSLPDADLPIISDVEFKNVPLEAENKEGKKRKINSIKRQEKQLEREKHNQELREQGYKQLMHLLSKSKFYTSFLLNKVEKPDKKAKQRKKTSFKDENIPPKLKLKGYNIKEQIKTVRNKLNLSNEDIEAELKADSDIEDETLTNTTIALKYFYGDLYNYQTEGLHWLKMLYENGLNGILADEMGLGKTIQVIALICYLMEKKQSGPYLIIVPLSTISNWISEFKRFAPDIPILFFYGSKDERFAISKKIGRQHKLTNDYTTAPVVITTYEIVIKDTTFLSHIWRYIVIDEGQRIKNNECILFKRLKLFKSKNRLILTGTPLQNNLSELWSLLNFLLPEIFDKLAVFKSLFDLKEFENNAQKIIKEEEEKHVISSLREILKPFMLRRIKSDVCLEIPPKKELIIYTPITLLQHDLYKAVLNRDLQMLCKMESDLIIPTENGEKVKRRCTLQVKYVEENIDIEDTNDITIKKNRNVAEIKSKNDEQLSIWKQYTDITERNRDFLINIQTNKWWLYKKIINHPYLIHCPLDSTGLPMINEDLIKASGKFLVLDAMLAKLKAQGHKVLLFSTMTEILDIIEDYLTLRDYIYVRLDGRMKNDLREKNINQFNDDSNTFLFLISVKAGGVGLNLASADTVIIFDSHWNPQVDIQAMARCHRIGQTRPVVVYRLCTKGTVDEAIVQRSDSKRALEKVIISKNWCPSTFNKNTLLKLKELLLSKEYKIVTSEREVYTEAELNKLLDRSDLINQPINQI